jgi:hypothetical protein
MTKLIVSPIGILWRSQDGRNWKNDYSVRKLELGGKQL